MDLRVPIGTLQRCEPRSQICFASHACGRGQQPERELARPRAAARPWPRSPTVAHPAHALRQSLAYPQVARVSTQQRLRLTAEKRAWPRASTDALPLRVKAEGFGYLHLRHDRGMPKLHNQIVAAQVYLIQWWRGSLGMGYDR